MEKTNQNAQLECNPKDLNIYKNVVDTFRKDSKFFALFFRVVVNIFSVTWEISRKILTRFINFEISTGDLKDNEEPHVVFPDGEIIEFKVLKEDSFAKKQYRCLLYYASLREYGCTRKDSFACTLINRVHDEMENSKK